MKKALFSLSAIILISSFRGLSQDLNKVITDAQKNTQTELGKYTNKKKKSKPLTNDEVINGLKEALNVGTNNSTSSASKGNTRDRLSKWRPTRAKPTAARLAVPVKIRFSKVSPRNSWAPRSPKTHRKASIIFDLPEPFGPTIAVTLAGKSKTVFCANDLKP